MNPFNESMYNRKAKTMT